MSHNTNRAAARAFTLIELLVVIAIIAILASILFPVFNQARAKARQTVCLSQQKQWGLGFMMYVQDYDETFPSQQYGGEVPGTSDVNWMSVIQPYAEKKNTNASNRDASGKVASVLVICPDAASDRLGKTPTADFPRMTYGMNLWAVGNRNTPSGYAKASVDPRSFRPLSLFVNPATTVLIGEQAINYSQMVYWPINNDDNIVDAGAQLRNGDYRYATGNTIKPLFDHTMPGITCSGSGVAGCASNLDNRHSGGANYLFSDGHAKWHREDQLYSADGTRSWWTISNTWNRSIH